MESSPLLFEVQQSLPLCCSLAVIGGILEVAATAVTAVPSVKEAQGKDLKPWLYYMALAGNVSLQLTGSILSHLIAPWFGPVSVVVPFFYASTLLSNMGIFGWLLGLEFFSKIMRVGTFVIVVGVILLPVVGPSIQEDQEINELLFHIPAMLWFCFLLSAMTITGFMVGCTDVANYPMASRVPILLVARATSISLNLTVSRGFICNPSHALFVVLFVLKIVSGAIYTYAIVVQSTAVDQARFVPLNTTTIIVTNAATGILIWEDYKVISSWYGYVCVFALLGLGCDLLLSSPVALLTEDNPQFGVYNKASTILGRRSSISASGLNTTGHTATSHGYRPIPDLDDISETGHEYDYDIDEIDDDDDFEATERSYKDAWRELTLSSMNPSASAAFSFSTANQTATTQSAYQQGVKAMNRASNALTYMGQQSSRTLYAAGKSMERATTQTLQQGAAFASALSASITGSAATETTTTSYNKNVEEAAAATRDNMILPTSPMKKRKKGIMKKTISALKHPGRLFSHKSSKKKKSKDHQPPPPIGDSRQQQQQQQQPGRRDEENPQLSRGQLSYDSIRN